MHKGTKVIINTVFIIGGLINAVLHVLLKRRFYSKRTGREAVETAMKRTKAKIERIKEKKEK